ncbi:uncharacterized protein IL334_001217 [Kwoniella shivajii]|uniref:NADP-dependent oxidoreductase domain-containing protein n=1 Tax=Kwoniella shivajii TaxID=564305 RepID=A0ABZ1CRB4_9TREE|nr:hypothetical protein IL334_001217 [Kwoniella shivajii]
MPRLGFGSGGLKGDVGIDAVEYAMKSGYTLVDTAQQYANEEGVAREKIYICTKWQPPPEGSDLRPTPEQVRDEAHRSVLRLDKSGKEYLDMMLIHHPRPDAEGRANFWKGLALAQKEGWVRDIGVSNYFVPIPKASSSSRIDANKDLYDFELDEQDMKDLDGLDQGSAGRVSGIDPDNLPE